MTTPPKPPRPQPKLVAVPKIDPTATPTDGPLSMRDPFPASAAADAMQAFPPSISQAPPNFHQPVPAAPRIPNDIPDSGPKSLRVRTGEVVQKPLVVSILSTVLSSSATVAIAQAYFTSRSPNVDQSAAVTYGAVKPSIDKCLAAAERSQNFDAWILGYLQANGVKLPEGIPEPPRVEIKTTPAPAASVAPAVTPGKKGIPQPAKIEVVTRPPATPYGVDFGPLPEVLSGTESK